MISISIDSGYTVAIIKHKSNWTLLNSSELNSTVDIRNIALAKEILLEVNTPNKAINAIDKEDSQNCSLPSLIIIIESDMVFIKRIAYTVWNIWILFND